jgi:hypothetical protein
VGRGGELLARRTNPPLSLFSFPIPPPTHYLQFKGVPALLYHQRLSGWATYDLDENIGFCSLLTLAVDVF